MREVLFVVAMVLLGSGATIGDKIVKGSVLDQPRSMVPLQLVTAIAGLTGVAWFIYGFFPFRWWLPLASLVAFAIFGAFISVYVRRSYSAPLMAILISMAGFGVAIYVVVAGF